MGTLVLRLRNEEVIACELTYLMEIVEGPRTVLSSCIDAPIMFRFQVKEVCSSSSPVNLGKTVNKDEWRLTRTRIDA